MHWLVVIALVAGCSYRAAFDDCALTCETPDDCPAGMACTGEGYCRFAGSTLSCQAVLGDAGATQADGPPGTARCTGTAAACETFANNATCIAHERCAYTAATCAMTVDCTALFPGDDCDNTAGCHTDVVAPYCKPNAGYCGGATKAACEAKANCGFGGGCTGTPRQCTALFDAAACAAHAGCAWN